MSIALILSLSNRLSSIGTSAFEFCKNLQSVRIPKSVIYIGNSVFNYCTKLSGIIVEEGNANYSSLDGVLFNKNRAELHTFPSGKEGDYSIPSTVTVIKPGAFIYCNNLTAIYFTGKAPIIDLNAFEETSIIIYYPSNDPTWTEDVRQNYGGSITWVKRDPEESQETDPHSDVISINYNSLSGSHKFYYDDLFFYSDNNIY